MLKERHIQNIRYTKTAKDKVEVTDRVVIPTFIPKPNMKAVDITDLSQDKQGEMLELLNEFQLYVKDFSKPMFSFEQWAEHSKQIEISPKWRTFSIEKTEIV